MPSPVVWAPARRFPALVVREAVQDVTLPTDPESYTYKVRFHGQRTFIRATRQQAEQVLASGLGAVQAERVVSTTTTLVEL